MADNDSWIRALRASHERFADAVRPLAAGQVQGPSYASEWTIAQVASHLGSGAEIFGLLLDAGLAGAAAPGGDSFAAIWDAWNAKAPLSQVADSVAANEGFVARLESLSLPAQQSFALAAFGRDLDLAGLASMRLSEHAVHTWDVVVAADPAATVAADAVELLLPNLAATAGRTGKPVAGEPVTITTTGPAADFVVQTAPEVVFRKGSDDETSEAGEAALRMPAEALLRLVYGRLDPDHTPAGIAQDATVIRLRTVFPGF